MKKQKALLQKAFNILDKIKEKQVEIDLLKRMAELLLTYGYDVKGAIETLTKQINVLKTRYNEIAKDIHVYQFNTN